MDLYCLCHFLFDPFAPEVSVMTRGALWKTNFGLQLCIKKLITFLYTKTIYIAENNYILLTGEKDYWNYDKSDGLNSKLLKILYFHLIKICFNK